MGNFLTFDDMITPKLIEGIFAFIVLVCVVLAVVMAVQNSLLNAVILGIGGPLLARIYCEFMIVVFRIYSTLREVNEQLTDILEVLEEEESVPFV